MNDDLRQLLCRLSDGGLADEDAARLRDLLKADAAAREAYLDHVALEAQLESEFGGELPTAVPEKVVAFPVRRWLAWAAVFVVAAGAWFFLRTDSGAPARVLKTAGAELQPDLAAGAVVPRGVVTLTKGAIEIETARAARVVIEAPATFEFQSSQRLRLHRGRVAADVPPSAKGFTVITPGGEAIDLGTKFGVDVPHEGAAEIHVFQGEVIARPKGGGKRQSLRDGEALALNSGAGAARTMRSAAFIRSDEMTALGAGLAAGQRWRSESAASELRRDPALISLVDFESGEKAAGIFRIVQGRWPGSRAAEFVNVGDHMKFDAGGERPWPQLSMAAWVRIDRLGEPYQSLYHTDGWNEDKPGQVHWMINRDTTMRLALKHNTLAPGSPERQGFPDSHLPVLPEQGRWVHLAAVYDSEARTVRFFLNGEFDKETRQDIAHPARLGPAQIGNWDSKDRKLSGRIDEMLILGRTLSDDEVRALFAAGNPYR